MKAAERSHDLSAATDVAPEAGAAVVPNFFDGFFGDADFGEAFTRCLQRRSDVAPIVSFEPQASIKNEAFEFTGFRMETGGLFLTVGATIDQPARYFRSAKRIYWVLAGKSGDRRLAPVSNHATLALAAEMLMTIYAECCVL
jgi:hypothetical protein